MIIGLCGFINCGKGTVADILVTEHGYKKIAVADTLKDTVASMFDWPRELLEGDTEPSRAFREKIDEYWTEHFKRQITPRIVLQEFGTEVVREHWHKDFWLLSLKKKLQKHDNVVVPDVRFLNEVQAIRDAGGYVLRVRRGPEPRWYQTALCTPRLMEVNFPDVHVSEWAWVGILFDHVIENKNKAELSNQVKMTLQGLHPNHSNLYYSSDT